MLHIFIKNEMTLLSVSLWLQYRKTPGDCGTQLNNWQHLSIITERREKERKNKPRIGCQKLSLPYLFQIASINITGNGTFTS